MTQQQNEKIKEIAEFDGWVKRDIEFTHGRELYENDHHTQWLDSMPYLTDLNALHRVIKKIRYEFRDKIEPKEDAVNAYKRLGDSIYDAFDSDSLTDLVDAVYDAIVYLKQHDLCH